MVAVLLLLLARYVYGVAYKRLGSSCPDDLGNDSAGYNVSVINRRRSVPVVEGVCRH